jgi:transposase
MTTRRIALPKLTIGLDLGDRFTQLWTLDAQGRIVTTERLRTTPAALERHWGAHPRSRIVLEVGTHSPWVSRLLEHLGHEVLVANARQLRLIYGSDRKSDRVDAETLARLGRLDPTLLKPIHPRGAQAQADLAHLRARDCLGRSRPQLINHGRGAVKAWGARLPASSAPAFAAKAAAALPAELRDALAPLLGLLTSLTREIRGMERHLELVARERYPDTQRLRQPSGVGLLTALCDVLTLEDPGRFRQRRAVGPYLGLCPRRDQSGGHEAQLRITKRGDAMLRRRLVSGAQYSLGPFGPDTELQRWGHRLAERGGKNAKKRAVVAVARKLATLLHRLWVSGAAYQPLRAAA